jgi:hypothetical protein
VRLFPLAVREFQLLLPVLVSITTLPVVSAITTLLVVSAITTLIVVNAITTTLLIVSAHYYSAGRQCMLLLCW